MVVDKYRVFGDKAACVTAFAVDTGTIEINPETSAVKETNDIRLLSVFLDIFFLSLVRIKNFLNLARRSFDPLIPSPMAHTCNAVRYGNLFIR